MTSTPDPFLALEAVHQEGREYIASLATSCTIATLCHDHQQAAVYALEWQRFRRADAAILDLMADLVMIQLSEQLVPDAARVEAGS